MKLKYIVAVESKNLTEKDEVRLLDMDGTEYTNEQLFYGHLQDSIADIEKIKVELMEWLEDNLPTDEHWQRRTLDGQVWDNYGTY